VAITGKSEPKTLKLKGTIKKYVSILIDFGRTQNFVDINITKKSKPFCIL
jgi:hypothetical protein